MRCKTFVALLFIATSAGAQQNFQFLNRNILNWYEPYLNQKNTGFHTSVRPYRLEELDSIVTMDSVFHLQQLPGAHFPGKCWNWIAYDHIIHVNTADFQLSVDPLVNFSGGMDLEDSRGVWNNTRGLIIQGDIGAKKQVSFTTTARENQSKFPEYLTAFVKKYDVVPSQGKVRNFKTSQFDYANVTGYVSYSPSRYFNFQLGHDRNFFGDGYRSLLLSDNALEYPFFKITTTVWHIKYVNLYAEFDDAISGTIDSVIGVTRKWGSFHYLSWNIYPWIELGLFEGIIWPTNDSSRYRGFDVNYLNPIIFFRPIEFGLGSPDNATLGANLKIIPADDVVLYGQFFLDDLDIAAARAGKGYYRNKIGIQAGVKYYTDVGSSHLVLQAEMNQVNPYVYAAKEPLQNYTHYNQPLADPLGANFREFIQIAEFRFYQRYYINIKLQEAKIGLDTSATSNVGSNIFLSDFTIPNFPDSYGNFIGQGLLTHINSEDIRIGYILNPRTNLNIECGIFLRNFSNNNTEQLSKTVMLGLKTDIFNTYYDF